MIVVALGVGAALYAWGLVRVARMHRAFPRRAVACFVVALAVTVAALLGPLDRRSDASLAWHMVQHLALISVAAPLLILGAPLRLTLAALPSRAAAAVARVLSTRPMRALGHPAVAWLQFVFVLYAVHFSPLYEAALEHAWIHACAHVLFLTSALLFWNPILAVAPAPHAPSHPVRLLAIFLALPMSAFLGFAFYVTHHVMYAHYRAQPGALDDQMNAGAVMWLAGGTPLLVALLWIVADWAARDARTPEAAV